MKNMKCLNGLNYKMTTTEIKKRLLKYIDSDTLEEKIEEIENYRRWFSNYYRKKYINKILFNILETYVKHN